MKKICIDGNDGTGKTSLISILKSQFPEFEFQDRGLPSAITVNKIAEPADLTIILTCPVEVSLSRLIKSGADMNEHWHQPDILSYYHEQFLKIAHDNNWFVVDSSVEFISVLQKVVKLIECHKV